MPPKKVQDVIDDPLIGCDRNIRGPQSSNLIASLTAHLHLATSRKKGSALLEMIMNESSSVGIETTEYIINELQFERRRFGLEFDDRYEEVIMKSWMKSIFKNYGEDTSFKFLNLVNSNRERRLIKMSASAAGN